jgi:Zn-dependent metalloprotease
MRRIISLAKIWGILQLQQLLMLKECVHGEQQDIALQPRSQRQQQLHHRVLRRNKQGLPAIVVGRLGHVERMMANANDIGNDDDYDYNNDEAFRSSLEIEVLQILHEQFESLGAEELRITGRIRQNKKNGSLHVRLQELIHGRPVDGTSLAVHLSLNGTIYAMNGEHVNGRRSKASSTMMMTTTTTNSTTPAIDGETACGLAILAANISLSDVVQRTTLSNTSPELTNVMDFEGKACLAWKCHVEYHATNFIGQRTFRRDILYGDAQDGSLCAIHPQVYGLSGGGGGGDSGSNSGSSTTNTAGGAGAHVHTFTCIPANAAAPDPFLKTCTLYSNSTQVIRTGHNSLDCAHNYALATFKYYQDNHGLWSIDGNGMAMTSYVLNEAFNFDNAFWSGGSMTYGDGDQWFLPMSLDAGVVGHEFVRCIDDYYSSSTGPEMKQTALSPYCAYLLARFSQCSPDTWRHRVLFWFNILWRIWCTREC